MVELIFGGQGKKDFMRFKKTVTKGLEAFGSTTSIATSREITEDSLKLMLDKFKNQAFNDFAARRQPNYLWQNLCKPVGVTTARACTGMLQDISNYLDYFPRHNSNDLFTEGDLINILNQLVPREARGPK